MNLTPWFPGDVEPVREGVYQRMYDNDPNDLRWCFWDGDWHVGYGLIEHAATFRKGFAHHPAHRQLPWRGVLK